MFILPRRALVIAILCGAFSREGPAQSTPEARLATEVESTVASLASPPTLSAWKASHSRERIDFPHYETDKDPYEVDFTNQWCVTSVSGVPTGITRAASFYVPEVRPGVLPALPTEPAAVLTASCRFGAVWYEISGRNAVADVVKQLTAVWGAPEPPTRKERVQRLLIGGSGLWQDVSMWRRGIVTVWAAWTDWQKRNGAGLRSIVYIVRDRPRDFDLFTAGFDTAAAAMKIADLGPQLTADATPGTNCAALGAQVAVARLSRWLRAATNLQEERRAAALLVADAFVRCVEASGAKPDSLAALGVKFGPGCPQDGPEYAGNFRAQAKALDPSGAAGALAALASLQSPCSLKGSGSWAKRALEQGQRFRGKFAPGPWSPWVSFAMARAHETNLSFSVPPGEVESGVIYHLTPEQAHRERNGAIEEYEQFISAQPDSPPAVFAWQEAWRLRAGLLPSPTRFACGCE
jgi:hypothetical protein